MFGRSWGAGLLLVAAVSGAFSVQESAAVGALRRELNDLRFRYDFEANRLQQKVEQLEQRLQALESRAPAGGGAVVAPAPAAGGDRTLETVTARRLLLVDDAGVRRAAMNVTERFGPMLAFTDAGGQVRLMLSVPPEGPRVEMLDAGGTLRATFMLRGATPRWEMTDDTGVPRVVVTIRDGAGVIDTGEER